MFSSPKTRFLFIAVLLVVLAGMFVYAGTMEPDPGDNNYPSTSDVHENPDKYLNEKVSISGTVVDTDPLTIETTHKDETKTFVIQNANSDVSTGDQLTAFGTLQETDHIHATNVVHRGPWEAYYMYVVSFLAGLWVLGRLVNGWTIDTTKMTVVPRTDPLFTS